MLDFKKMGSFNQASGFQCIPNSSTMGDSDGDGGSELSGILEIYVHHARNIHNICIYENQDVYAKFSLTYNPDEALSTRIVNGGGKNPEFNEKLLIKVAQLDAVLKCEIWMLSRIRNCMEDQLLGFSLVPVSQVAGKGKVTQNYSLSSTDLFHSPAGMIRLTLSLNTTFPLNPSTSSSSSISSEVVFLDRKALAANMDPVEYSRIEFPDIRVVRENQQMVSEYFDGLGSMPGSFLHLGTCPQPDVIDYEMSIASSEETQGGGSTSPNGSIQNSGFLSSPTTSLSDDRTSSESIERKNHLGTQSSHLLNDHGLCNFPETPTSEKGNEARDDKDSNFSCKVEENNTNSAKFDQAFSTPLGNINLEAEQSAMQQQIVDMYIRSMQQFTESLAKMKLPMDLDNPEHEFHSHMIQNHRSKIEIEKKNEKKDGSRVFYGSRAFF